MSKNRTQLNCPICHGKMVQTKGEYGLYYRCENYPACDCTIGAHQKTGAPLGRPVDRETRQYRVKAHESFDQLWKKRHMRRTDAYTWLAKAMGMRLSHGKRKEVHIANMSTQQCKQIIILCDRKAGVLVMGATGSL